MQVNVLVVELKSEALKERHWKQLIKKLRVNWVLSELTLGHVWDVNLQKHEAIVRDVISVAQGEMALEEFLKQVIFSLNFALIYDVIVSINTDSRADHLRFLQDLAMHTGNLHFLHTQLTC